jgi:hypothetical protein
MNRMFLLAALLAVVSLSNAQEAPAPSFKANTLGEAAAYANDLAEPMTIELEIPLHGPVKDLEPLVTYLRAQGFDLVAEVTPPPGTGGKIESLAFKARKHGVLAKESIDKWAKEVTPLVPEGLKANWIMRQVRKGG